MPDDDLAHFAQLIHALRPVLDRVVVIGGWGHRLYRYRQEALAPSHAPLFTDDTDIVLPPQMGEAVDVGAHLLANGFVEELAGDEQPPVTHYRLKHEDTSFYAEFLTPKVGGGGRPGKTPQDTETIAGVVAQKLRYLDVLLIEPWSIVLGTDVAPVLEQPATVRIANPVCYLAQKLLAFPKRKPTDQGKDILYIHDTIELFAPSLEELAACWLNLIRPRLVPSVARKVERFAVELFVEVTDPIREAARVARSRQIRPEAIRLVCELGLRDVFDRKVE